MEEIEIREKDNYVFGNAKIMWSFIFGKRLKKNYISIAYLAMCFNKRKVFFERAKSMFLCVRINCFQ